LDEPGSQYISTMLTYVVCSKMGCASDPKWPVKWAISSPPRNTGPGDTRSFGLLGGENAALAVDRLQPNTSV
jgi:hypothetical protein